MNILILGAGPCGLGAAYYLNKLGHTDWQLFERNNHVGGLSASFLDLIRSDPPLGELFVPSPSSTQSAYALLH
jgi:protoporphyrinogen oxidase